MKISELPFKERELALLRQLQCEDLDSVKDSDHLMSAFLWKATAEGNDYWEKWDNFIFLIKEEPKHYDNSKGSLYKFCDEHELNSYEFDIIKRVMRCRKKGLFLEDLEKTKFAIDLYIKEQLEKNK
jgi:hypothetical protein